MNNSSDISSLTECFLEKIPSFLQWCSPKTLPMITQFKSNTYKYITSNNLKQRDPLSSLQADRPFSYNSSSNTILISKSKNNNFIIFIVCPETTKHSYTEATQPVSQKQDEDRNFHERTTKLFAKILFDKMSNCPRKFYKHL